MSALFAALTFHAPSSMGQADNSPDRQHPQEGLLVGMRSS